MFGAIGSLIGGLFGNSQKKKEMQFQDELSRTSVQRRVADAKAANVHPSIALGMQPMSYSPVGLGSDFQDMGQNVGRAIDATMTQADKNSAFTKKMQELTLTRGELENNLLMSQIQRNSQAGTPPPMPSLASPSGVGPGQNNEAYNAAQETHPGYGFAPGMTAQQIEDDTGDLDIPALVARIWRKYDKNHDVFFPDRASWRKYYEQRSSHAKGRAQSRAMMHERRANPRVNYGYW